MASTSNVHLPSWLERRTIEACSPRSCTPRSPSNAPGSLRADRCATARCAARRRPSPGAGTLPETREGAGRCARPLRRGGGAPRGESGARVLPGDPASRGRGAGGQRRLTCSQLRATLSLRSALTVSTPAPQVIVSLRPSRAAMVSLPAPPEIVSCPAPPESVSSPASPSTSSSPPWPRSTSSPAPPFRWSAPAPPSMWSSPSSPQMSSSPRSPLRSSSCSVPSSSPCSAASSPAAGAGTAVPAGAVAGWSPVSGASAASPRSPSPSRPPWSRMDAAVAGVAGAVGQAAAAEPAPSWSSAWTATALTPRASSAHRHARSMRFMGCLFLFLRCVVRGRPARRAFGHGVAARIRLRRPRSGTGGRIDERASSGGDRSERACAADGGSAVARDVSEQRPGDDEALDLPRALVDLSDLGVAVVALGRKLLRVAVAAEHLDRLAGPVPRDPAREQLRLRPLDRVRPARLLQPRRPPDQGAGRLDLGLHVRELLLDRLERADRTAERLALPGVRRRDVERGLRDPDRLRRDADAPGVERAQRDPHPGARLAEPLAGRVLEAQVGGRGRVQAELLLLARGPEPGRAAADEERAGALALRLAGEHDERVGVRAVRDPLLRAADPALAVRTSAHRPRVGAGARLGQRERGELVALGERRDEAVDLLAAAVLEDRQRAGARVDGDRHAEAGVRARQLLENEAVAEEVGPGPGVLLGDADPHEAELAEVLDDLLRERVLAVPRGGGRRDLLVGEAPREVADLALVVGQLVQAHGVFYRRTAVRRAPARRAAVWPALPTSAASPSAAPAFSRRPRVSKRRTAHPSSRATRARTASGFTATGWPTARSIGRSDSESE